MSTSSLSLPSSLGRGRASARLRSLTRPRPELAGLLVLAGLLNMWALSRNGWANDYYSAAVRSMSTNWHAFLYGSFDASGVMTVDKPPLAFWVQALSVRAFGFSSWSLLVPQALMGVATVGLTYDLVRRRFGRIAGFAGGIVLALTPITVAISRHNNPDALLVLCCVAALWALVRGLEDGRTRWLLLAGLMVGLGFETKMLVAFMVVPGIALAWLWVAPRGRAAAVRQLLAGGAVMLAVSLAWPVLMWLTPAADRPWISGTSDNSIWSLIFGYNGLGRVVGQSGGPGGAVGGAGGGGANGLFGGSTGPLRLLNQALGGQASWLLGFAAVTVVALAVITRLRRTDARTGWLIAVGGSLVVTAAVFSEASGIFHPYYVSLLAPFIAALVGAGVGQMLGGGRVMRIAGPLAIAAGVACELVVLHDNPGSLTWLAPILVIGGLAAAAALGLPSARPVRRAAVAGIVALLLLAPGTWAVQTLGHPTSSTFPAGGPASTGQGFGGGPGGGGSLGGRPPAGAGAAGGFGGPPPGMQLRGGAGGFRGGGGFGGGLSGATSQTLTEAVAYAKAHGGGAVAVSSQTGAAGSLIASGADVVGIGGFSGRESQVSISWLANAVASGKIRYVLTDGTTGGLPQDSRVGASDVMAVAAQVGAKVSSVSGLYDLQGKAAALRASAS
jgi:4-amino-4-deoxy-L-arabinose transferase-like glycosyltransferase